ncbi:CIA30 family protein [Pseudoduganella sp. RAF19]|uniref:CIA30 family protein n=1 Tax=Pseudoduganella sp. RAF19 TaxID=3233052 RepID=UPI003F94EB49
MPNRLIASALLAAGLASALPALAADPYLIRDVRVFDGQKLLPKRNVLIASGVIASLEHQGPVPEHTVVIDGHGLTLMPGLIDSHVHAYQNFSMPLLFGVTSELDMFTSVSVLQDMNRRMERNENKDRPDIFSAGTLATAPGGHGTEYGLPVPTLTKPEEAQPWVDARIAEGSHFIKIVMEPGSATHAIPTLDKPVVKALIEAAHKRGKLAVVHISNFADARTALELGADGLVHLFTGEAIGDADLKSFVQLARQRKAFIVPTFSVMESMAGLQEEDVLSDKDMVSLLNKEQIAPLKATYGQAAKPQMLVAPNAVVAALKKAGVPILAGTDAGNTGTQYGVSLHHELLSLTKAGLTPSEALTAATATPARVFKLPIRGRVVKGYKADLLLVDGDPTHDITATRRIVEVWKDGEPQSAVRKDQQEKVAQQLAAPKAQQLALPADGRISLFSKDKLASPFGAGWMPSNDAFLGGKSTVQVDYHDDANRAVQIKANVQAGFAFPWAGLAFMPGVQPMEAADLSAARTLRFRVKGDGQKYQVMILSKGGAIPASQTFAAGSDWQEVSLPLDSFKGVDTSAITMIGFNAGPKTGEYQFELADVRLMP